ncbi:hypothetical protein ACFTSF_06490 [Kribbella sp. NPDC056951]|uniref:PGN_0703 family putative restriction endonuclease n=1 Tax=Kribbella sp. NPDC056951 TaxID=3345978 RepID=UPI00362C0768
MQLPYFGRAAGSGGRLLGSVLTDSDAALGLNFTSRAAHDLYLRRRKVGWGVDPVRCTKYMTSSQALTLNLFGPLADSPAWCRNLLNKLLGRDDLRRVLATDIEFAPRRRSEYLGDMTRVDVLMHIETDRGTEAIVVEVKYADRFNSRFVDLRRNSSYRNLADTTQLWAKPDVILASRQVNQLARVHALAASILGPTHSRTLPPTLIVIHHPDDARAHHYVDAYRGLVTSPDTVASVDMRALFDAMQGTAIASPDQSIVEEMATRYIGHAYSDAAWNAYRSRPCDAQLQSHEPAH